MGETWSEIPESLIEWIKKQHMFWVASAPLSPDGHVNISPKGVAGTFHVESPTRVWYEDLSGSGAETIAHIRENRRITILFNAFDGPPRITRLTYEALLPPGTRQPGSRAIVVVDVYKVGTTCGYSVPYYSFVGHRTPLLDWAARKEATDLASSKTTLRPPHDSGSQVESKSSADPHASEAPGAPPQSDRVAEPHPNGLLAWWRDRNTYSLDGLPALSLAFRQPASSLGGHQPVRKARYSALNQYPPSKQPVDDVPPTASDIRSRRRSTMSLWVLCWVRWFLSYQLIASFLTLLNTVAGSLVVKVSSAKTMPNTTTLFIHGERIEESPNEAGEVSWPPVSWGAEHNRVSAAKSVAPPGALTATGSGPQPWWALTRARALSPSPTVLLGYGVSFLLGMIFMMFYVEVQTSAGTIHAAASVFRERSLFSAIST